MMRVSCLAILFSLHAKAWADDDYSKALTLADLAEQHGDVAKMHAAARALERVASAYPRDYTLVLRLGWIHFRLQNYRQAERWYRMATVLSAGGADAVLGLGWSLIYQKRCAEAAAILQPLLEPAAFDQRAQDALSTCTPAEARAPATVHGSLWFSLSGVLYHDNPWKRRSGDVSVGGTLAPLGPLQLGAAYRYLALQATDRRVAGYAQHEGYVQAGYESAPFGVLAHGALITSVDSGVGVSRHLGLSSRLRVLGELLLDLSASFYQDLWVTRIAPAWRLIFGHFSITPGLAIQRFARDTLGSGSLGAAFSARTWSIWIHGRLGEEYRAAQLPLFAVFNSEDRSAWALAAGVRIGLGACCAVFASYGFQRLKSPDGLGSDMHSLSVGATSIL